MDCCFVPAQEHYWKWLVTPNTSAPRSVSSVWGRLLGSIASPPWHRLDFCVPRVPDLHVLPGDFGEVVNHSDLCFGTIFLRMVPFSRMMANHAVRVRRI